MQTTTRWTWATLALVAFLAPNAFLQDTQDEPEPPGLNPLRPVATSNPQGELERLFSEVERRLRAIDSLLIDASAGDTTQLTDLGESGIQELIQEASPSASAAGVGGVLRASQGQGQRVISGIDRIIEIAEQNGGQCSSPGDANPVGNQGEQRTDKSKSPKDPGGECESPGACEGEPCCNKSSDESSDIKPAQKTPDSEVEAAPIVVASREHWGDLPLHHRDIFRAEGGKQLPAQYRDWIDAYYRRLNARANN